MKFARYLHRCLTRFELPTLRLITKRHCFSTITKTGTFPYKQPVFTAVTKRFNHDDRELEFGDDTKQTNEVYEEIYEQPIVMRRVLYSNSTDELMKKINDCVSTQEALGVVKEFKDMLTVSHLTQAVVTFWDLQKMYHHVNILRSNSHIDETVFDKMNHNYTKLIFEDEGFKTFLESIDKNIHKFNTEQLSYIVLYLNKMGFSIKNEIFQKLVIEFNSKFVGEKFCLEELSRFMTGLFKKNDLSFYYAIQHHIPALYEQIEKVETADSVNLLTMCLSTLNVLIPNDILLKYKTKIYELVIKGILSHNEYKSIIRIAMFLNYPQWRPENSRIICDCLKLLKGHLYLLNVNDILAVYEVFYKLQEPGDILNELQRCASKHLLHLEEDLSPLLDVRLRLFSCVMYFTSPSQRRHFDKIIRKYMDYNLDGNSIMELQKIILFTKVNDVNLCRSFWGKIVTYLDDENFTKNNLLRVCNSYINFEEITNTFRHVQCENKLLELLEKEFKFGLLGMMPSHFSSMASFILIYSHDRSMLNAVTKRIEEFADQFNPVDCLNISQSLVYAKVDNQMLSDDDYRRVDRVLDYTTRNLSGKVKPSETVLLLKAALSRRNLQNYSGLWQNVNEILSSGLLKGFSYCLYTSSTLIPNMIDLLTEYIIRNRTSVLGFNIERVLYLCFHLGYTPKNSKQFFDNVINILIRDQERMSGLSYLQACLALSFFNVLPQSFIQQIFNEEFLEKLDVELENCYFKDIYPFRVRQCLMRLNRAVCLDHPEANVPWFHQKYVEETISKSFKKSKTSIQHQTLFESLVQLAGREDIIKKHATLPYGYHADFVVYLDKKKRLTSKEESIQKVAILVLKQRGYTKGVVQFKGSVQMKMRHLEMLGYKVAIINHEEWSGLIYGQDRIEYLNEALALREVSISTDILMNR